MTTRSQLLETIANGENSGVDFKRDTLENHALAKALMAFSNLEGGMVLLGVDNDGTIAGLTRSHLEEWVMTVCRDSISPGIIPFFEIVKNVQPGKDVAIVRVPRGSDVCARRHGNKNTYYVRVGTQSREATASELSRLFQQRGSLRADLRPIPGTALSDLDEYRLADYFVRIREQAAPTSAEDWKTLLINTEISAEEGITAAGLLLFGTEPNRHLPHAGIDAAAFLGTEKDYATKERATLRGPMVPRMDGKGRLLENGLAEQAAAFVQRNTGATAILEDGMRRIDKPAYPPDVIREVIVNALIHRDYLMAHTDIELAIYSDRLEVVSPGRLPNGVTPERMRAGVRASRNPLLKDVMRDYGYLEHMGLGVPRKIIKGMREHNGTEPDLVEENERFVVRLFCE